MNPSDFFRIFSGLKIYSCACLKTLSYPRLLYQSIYTYSDSIHDYINLFRKFFTQKNILLFLSFYLYLYYNKPLLFAIIKFYIILFSCEILASLFRVFTHRNNKCYESYFQIRNETCVNPSLTNFEKLTRFHTDFDSYPICFTATKPRDLSIKNYNPLISYLVYLAEFMVYPGSKFPMKFLFKHMLFTSREIMIYKKFIRFKIKTAYGNYLDSMYKKGKNGVLVIMSAGNCCFYETILETLCGSDYSALGWNHLGFGCSTGRPLTSHECDAILSVIEFATEVLQYEKENIIVYGWSIGTFTASYASKIYPSLKAIILDAGFDNLKDLGLRTLGSNLYGLLKPIIDVHFNLDINANIQDYHGPILVSLHDIDEIMCNGPPCTNVGVNIIRSLIQRDLKNNESNMQLDLTNENIYKNIPILDGSSNNDQKDNELYPILEKYACLQTSSPHGDIIIKKLLHLLEERGLI